MFPYYWNGQVFPERTSDSIFRKDLGLDNLPDEVREILELHKNEVKNPEVRAEMQKHLKQR